MKEGKNANDDAPDVLTGIIEHRENYEAPQSYEGYF